MRLLTLARPLMLTLIVLFISSIAINAQTTAFTYQGSLIDAGNPANGNYLLQFKLYDAAAGGNQIGSTLSNIAVIATTGVFTARLDFTATPFTGADRFLEISVKKNAADPYITLSPRQQINSSPYSIRTLSAAQADVALDSQKLGGVEASEYVTTATVGNSFIRNSTTQQTADFNVSGDGVVGNSLGVGGTPQAGQRLDVTGNSVFRTANGNINFGSPNSETGMSVITNANRADFRFNGSTLKMVAAAGAGPPADTNGVSVNTAGNVGIGTIIPQAKLHVAGNAAQDRANGGLVKATLLVGADGLIRRCYNGVTGAAAGSCGFTVTGSGGFYTVNFGFQVSDRFLSVTAQSPSTQIGVPPTPYGANFRFSTLPNSNPQETTVYTFRADTGATEGVPFMLIVF